MMKYFPWRSKRWFRQPSSMIGKSLDPSIVALILCLGISSLSTFGMAMFIRHLYPTKKVYVYSYKKALTLCWKDAKKFVSNSDTRGILDERYDWHKHAKIINEPFPGAFTTIVDVRCDRDSDKDQGRHSEVIGIAYVLTRGTVKAPPKLEPIQITEAYKYEID